MESAGTPLWLTLLLQVGTVVVTHHLAARRESSKARKDELKEWKKEHVDLLRECVDAAVTHYVDPAALAGTAVSAARILDTLRRFRLNLNKYRGEDESVCASAASLYVRFHGAITGADDFDLATRDIRSLDDPLLNTIRELESSLRKNLDKKRIASTG